VNFEVVAASSEFGRFGTECWRTSGRQLDVGQLNVNMKQLLHVVDFLK